MRPGEGYGRLEAEIRRERAEALGRAGERLDDTLARLREFEREVAVLRARPGASADLDRRLAACLAARDRVRAEAQRLRHYLVIQREALGLVRHTLVDEHYRLPDP